jgi:hypothetical protein
MSFNLHSAATLSFELPGRHWQTGLVVPLTTDILAYREGYAVQRFRVTGMNVSKSGGELKCAYTAVSYKELINAWIFSTGNTLNWGSATEQTAIAWTIISETEALSKGEMTLTRGTTPASAVNRTLDGLDAADYYALGSRKGDAIREIAEMANGFEWDIEPDRTSATTERSGLKFNTWNAGARRQYTPLSPFVLDDGGNVSGWSVQSAPSEFANVVYVTGKTDDPDSAIPVAWRPSDRVPTGTAYEGRWERAVSSDAASQAAVDAVADGELTRSLAYQQAWSVDIASGRWLGPTEMWIGDYCRLMISDGPIDVADDVRVATITIAVDDNGAEKLTLALDREARTYAEFRSDLERRMLSLERR